MSNPRVPRTLWTERAGILAVAAHVNRLGLIWREQPNVDVGIDGHIELVDSNGRATGRIVAVQVKSGPSYFRDCEDHWIFTPDEKHRFYWELYPLPVLLMLHSPAEASTWWVDARQALRGGERLVAIPKSNLLQTASAADLFYSAGATAGTFLDVPAVLRALCSIRTPFPTFRLSYFDLFANGLINNATAVYFGMDVAMEVAEANLPGGAEWMTLEPGTHEFLFGFLHFLVEQNLADVDLSYCLVDWHVRGQLPATIAPLTSRGQALVRLIGDEQERFQREGRLEHLGYLAVAQEDFIRMVFAPSHHTRLSLIDAFQEQVRAEAGEANAP